jgi:hypothetical protein
MPPDRVGFHRPGPFRCMPRLTVVSLLCWGCGGGGSELGIDAGDVDQGTSLTVKAAAEMPAQVAALRAQSGVDPMMEAGLRELLVSADQMEADSRVEAGSVSRNAEVVRGARPAVTDEMWAALGLAGGGSGFLALSAWHDPEDAETQAKLDQIRQLLEDILENRASSAPALFQ